MSNASTFGQWLKQRRKALGLTQRGLAQQAGCVEITLRKIEAGDLQPSATLVAFLAGALGVTDADLPGLLSLWRAARATTFLPERACYVRSGPTTSLPSSLPFSAVHATAPPCANGCSTPAPGWSRW